MKASKLPKKPINCPSCGAPVTSEICAYCGTATGLKSADANMEYPVLDCNEVVLRKEDAKFLVTMGVLFFLIGVAIILIFAVLCKEDFVFTCIIAVPFMILGIGTAFYPLVKVFKYVIMKVFGKKIQAKVYGYLDDDMTINGRTAQIVKLRVDSQDGPRFVLYQLENTLRPYGIHSTVDVMVLGDNYMICENKRKAKR